MKLKYIILSERVWHRKLFQDLKKLINVDWWFIDRNDDFTLKNIEAIKPDKIFIPHWSHHIPSQIHRSYECILFHMTDLPYGRGGSPLQNLIERGHTETMISAIRVVKEVDSGPVYLKMPLQLYGTAQEIFLRSTNQIKEMILRIHNSAPVPREQIGEPVVFKRRKPDQSTISAIKDIGKLFDHIRMLDCEGYPFAFLETEHFRLEFTRANLKDFNTIFADVRIVQK